MKKILTAASVVFCFLSAGAQFTYDYLKAADNYFKKGDWYSASQYYEKYLGSKGGKKEAYNPYVVQTASSKNLPRPVQWNRQFIILLKAIAC